MRRRVLLRRLGAATVAACLLLAAAAFAELWVGAAVLPRGLPAPPYWLARGLHSLPFAHSRAWSAVRHKLAGVSLMPAATPPWSAPLGAGQDALSAGSYLGWSGAGAGSLTLYGHACPADDPLTALTLTTAGHDVTVTAADLAQLDVDVGIGYRLPLTRVTAALPVGDYAATAVARCRSGSERRHQLGAVHVVAAPANPAGIQAFLTSAPAAGSYAELVVVNPGPHVVTLTSLEYAPGAAASGLVLASAGPPARFTRAGLDLRPPPRLPYPSEPAAPDAWPPAGFEELAAAPLDHLLRPGEARLYVVHAGSFHPTRPPLPAIFHPTVGYALQDGTSGGVLDLERPAVGWTWQ